MKDTLYGTRIGWIGVVMALAVGKVGMAGDYRSLVTNANPIAYYRLNEPSGTDAADEQATWNGVYCYTSHITFGRSGALAGDTNRAVAFDGIQNWMAIPSDAQLVHDTHDFTIEGWIKPDSAGMINLLSYRNNSQLDDYQFYMAYGNSMRIWAGTSFHILWNSTTYSTNGSTWYHVVYTRTGNVFRTYLNGVQQGSDVSDAKDLESAASSYSYRIGCGGDYGSEVQFYDGDLDEFAFYDYALSSNTILEHYQCGTTAFTVTPQSGPFAGGNSLLIANCVPAIGNGSDITNIVVGGVGTTNILGQGTNWVSLIMPPAGSAGVKDIVIQSTSLGATTLASAYTYNPAGQIGGTNADWTRWAEVQSLPDVRYDLGAGTLDNALYAIGGVGSSGNSTNVYRYYGTNWTDVAGLPAPWSALATDVLNGYLYAIGGFSGSGSETNVYRYDGTNWTDVAGLPAARRLLGAGVLNSKLYAVGGYSTGAKTNVYQYDGTNWTEVAGLPAARYGLAVGVLNGFLYAVGGSDGATACTNVYRYDGTNWTEVAGLPLPLLRLAGAVLNNAFYAIGGQTTFSYASAKTNVFRYNGTNWTAVPGLPDERYALAASVLDGAIYAAGGINDQYWNMANVYQYPAQTVYSGVEPSSGSWTGGYQVVISGTNLCDGMIGDVTNVTLCGIAAAVTGVAGSTQIVVTAGAGAPGPGDVRVYSTSAGESVKSNGFTYNPVITAGAGPHGAVSPSGVVDVSYGGTTSFVATADAYYHIGALATNGVSVAEATNRPVYTSVWENVTATGTLVAAFSENLTTNTGTPEWWLAQHGLTNNFNAAATNDADGDRMTTWAEYIADTDPTNAVSCLRVVLISNGPPVLVYFNSSSNREYSLQYSTNLVGGSWTNVPDENQIEQPGNGGRDELADTNAASAQRFYRITVGLP